MSVAEPACVSCIHHSTTGKLDDVSQTCWSCAAAHSKDRPYWQPKPAPHPYSTPEVRVEVPYVGAPTVDVKHYTKMAITPFQYGMANGLDAMQFTAIKYISRFRDKGGLRDLHAAIKTINELIKWEEKNAATSK